MKQRSSKIALYVFLIIALMSLTFVTTSVIAYIVRNSGEVKNDFSPAVSVQPEIVETFTDKKVKENVSFKVGNTGYPVYVRAAIVITWQDKDGVVYFSKPVEGTDYTIELDKTNWTLEDGYYYYVDGNQLKEVQSNGTTDVLIKSCEQLSEAPSDGYTLSVEIIVQTIQAIGSTDTDNKPAYKDAWGLSR